MFMVSRKCRFDRWNCTRANRGFSLVSVVITASLTAMFLAASAAAIIPLFRSIGAGSTDALMLTAAESANDYVVGLLNSPSSRPDVDCAPIYGDSKHVNETLPLSSAMFGLPDSATIDVYVRNIAPSPISTAGDSSRAFDPLLNPYSDPSLPIEIKNYGEKWGLIGGGIKNQWRVIETRVRWGAREKLLLCTLKPVLEAKGIGIAGGSENLLPKTGGTGLKTFYLGAGSSTSGYDSLSGTEYSFDGYRLGGDIGSFGKVLLGPNSETGGKIVMFPDQENSVAGITAKNIDGTAIVNQYIRSEGLSDGFHYVDGDPSGTNVLNKGSTSGDVELQRIQSTAESDIINASGAVAPSVASAPSAPSTAATMEQIGGGSQTVSGDYSVSSLDVGQGTSLSVQSGDTARIFIEPTASVDSPVTISGNVIANNPADLQIFYNGTGTISIQPTGNTVNAVIYAPNANVVIGGSAGHLDFNGSILARNVAGKFDDNGVPSEGVKNTSFKFDRGAGDAANASSSNSSFKSLTYNPSDLQTGARLKVVNVLEPRNPKDIRYQH
ncbi:MAG: hypothetical protein IPK73_10905 [Candidatus Obscuribacter sp.]|nr:hypothetical protein [Candidatus Obscuribacter sp.]MBK9281524.1 hypothetical protein [Candidatus Obscuribacter sp.]